jgi:hypothetical protein
MEKLFYEIYEKVVSYENDVIRMNLHADNEIMECLELYEKRLDNEEMSQLQDRLFHTVQTAERESFYLGVEYTVKMLAALLGDKK